MLRQQTAQQLLALDERKAAKVLPASEHDIENAVPQRCLRPQRILEQLEMRNAPCIERNELSVQHGVRLHLFQRLCDLSIAVTDDLAVAGVKGDFAACNVGNH